MKKTSDDKIRYFRGKKLEKNEEEYKKHAIAAGNRVLLFSKQSLEWKINGKVAGMMDFRGIIIPDPNYNGTSVKLDTPGLKIKKDLVGFAGMYTHPYWIGAENVDETVKAWNWFFEQSKISHVQLALLEFYFIVQHIWTGYNLPQAFRMLSLIVDLYDLKQQGIDIKVKLSEINRKIKGNLRAAQKFDKKDKLESLMRLDALINQVSDAFAESRLARFAKSMNYNIQMSSHPDILVDGVRIEVKFDRKEFELSKNSLADDIEKGLKQNADLIAIFTADLRSKKIPNQKLNWFASSDLKTCFEMGLDTSKNGRKCLLLFTSSDKGYFGRLALFH